MRTLLVCLILVAICIASYVYNLPILLLISVLVITAWLGVRVKLLEGPMLAVGAGVFALLAVESALSLKSAFSTPSSYSVHDGERASPQNFFAKNTLFGYLARPGTHIIEKHSVVGEKIYSARYTIGQDGFRVTPNAASQPRETYFLGGSFTFVEGVNDDETLPTYWQALNPRYAAENFGMPGWGIHQAVRLLETARFQDAGIYIVQTLPWHAERSACRPLWSLGNPRYVWDGKKISLRGKCGLSEFFNESAIYQIFKRVMFNPDAAFSLYIKLLKRLDDLVKNKSGQLIVAFVRSPESSFSGTSWSNDKVVDELGQAGLNVVDVTLATKREELAPDYFIKGDGHPTALAHAERAKLLTKALQIKGDSEVSLNVH